ncbi:LIM/homeobox protein Lhx9-like isoform X8 [Octopus sinensis]|uniref:LIM/homeobox protein Lhx9-like isoform X8 n=1 Tax=Octopus sinensis TaxID=2607531 RepID=A0A7E6EQW1_9MOLL|nr:LIM/homeobox protein Lhx9-like isoform X8 [Octopus sinensis]
MWSKWQLWLQVSPRDLKRQQMVLGGNFLLLDCLKVTFKDQFRMSDSPKDLRADSLESPSRMWLCASCGKRIMDRYYMMVAERQWHASCLKCCECKLRLDSYLTCFARNGNLYCKEDYYRRYAIRQCARCNTGISAQELVMRVRDLVYHLGCFVCEGCNRPLTKGDHFGMKGDLVYCRTDYELLFQEGCREYVPLREQRTDESGGHNESLCDVRPLVAGLERGHVPSNYTGVVLPIQPKGRSRKRKTGCLNATLNCQAGLVPERTSQVSKKHFEARRETNTTTTTTTTTATTTAPSGGGHGADL